MTAKEHNFINDVCVDCGRSRSAAEHFGWACGEAGKSDSQESIETKTARPKENDAMVSMRKRGEPFIEIDVGGESVCYGKEELATSLRKDILEGKHKRDSKVISHFKGEEEAWQKLDTTLGEFSKEHFPLRSLYQPVWSHAMAGLKWGAIIGIGLKLLDSLVLLSAVDPALGFLFLVAIGVCFIPKIGMMAVIAISIFMMKFSSVNFFLVGMVAAFTGAVIGCLPGMTIGGIIGFLRRKSLPVAAGEACEPEGLLLKAVILPLAGGGGITAFYLFVVNPWILSFFE